MSEETAPDPQTAPSPASVHVPPGAWRLVVTDDAGTELATLDLTGPDNVRVELQHAAAD